MRRVVFVLSLFAVLVVVAILLIPRAREPSVDEPIAKDLVTSFSVETAPVEGAPCRIDGLIDGALATRVRIHSERARLDSDARLLRGGRAYSGEIPEQGRLHVFALAADGRTTNADAVCGGDGHLQVDLRFPTTDPHGAIVTGVCTYLETGAPVDEALIRATRTERGRTIGESAWSTLTDGEGRFTLPIPPGEIAVRCGKDGDEGDPIPVHVLQGGHETVELFVEARAAIAGVVLRGGEPVAGVSVSARSSNARDNERSSSDREGRFVIRGLAPGAVVVEAHHEGAFAEAHAIAKVELPYAEVKLVLTPSRLGIGGVVLDEEGPITGASIAVREETGTESLAREAISDPDGRFTIGGLVRGSYRLETKAIGYATLSRTVEVNEGIADVELMLARACRTRLRVLPDRPKQGLTISVRPKDGERTSFAGETGEWLETFGPRGEATIIARTVGGAVRTATRAVELCGPDIALELPGDEGTGVIEASVRDRERSPIAGIRVWVERIGSGKTGADGKVRFEGLRPGEYWVGARDADPAHVEVQAELTAQIELVLAREAGAIEGTVVSGSDPVEGARVLAACTDSGRDRGVERAWVVARSGADGRFSFEPKNGSVCTVRAEHVERGRSEPVTLRTNGPDAVIRLLKAGSIAGRVSLFETNVPVDRYAITARSIGRATELEVRTVYIDDASGRYRIDDVAPGHVSVTVTADRGSAHREVELASGEDKRSVDFVVFREGVVKGRVLGKRGAPLAAANVMLRALGRARATPTTDAEGRFETTVPAGDPLRVFVRADGFYPWGSLPFDLTPGEPVDLGDIVLAPRGGDEEKDGGIGVMFSGEPRGIRVIRFTADSPARDAGMEVGDLITAIDGIPAGREPMVNWVVSLRGIAGTAVVLEVERGTVPPFNVTVIRRSIGLDPVP